MAVKSSLECSMDKAVKRYSSLFRLPSGRKVLMLLGLLCVGGGLSSAVIFFPSLRGLGLGLFLGFTLFLVDLAADYAVETLMLGRGTIFDLRRTVALSLFCWAFWLLFLFAGTGIAILFGTAWWVRLCLLGFSAVIILRLMVFSSTSSMNYKRVLLASITQPFFCSMPFLLLWVGTGYPITILMPLFFLLSLILGLFSVFGFLSLLDRVGKKTIGMHGLAFFKAFMLNWVLDLNRPFEELLEKIGEQRDVEVSLMMLGSSKLKAAVVVPSVHPGPFRNIGSSPLPSLLKANLEKKFDCVACVPHGLFGHEFDLASQQQNKKIINDVAASLNDFKATEETASPFVKISNGVATACCQVFGKYAFVSFTLAPMTIEDLPQELGLFVREEAERHGLDLYAVVNAHNSIDGTANMQESLAMLKDAATKCLERATSLEQSPFEVGAATVMPEEFSLEDGMGSGGITVLVFKGGKQRIAYVVIDGNNMVSGLREEILSALSSLGIDDGEVFTTDTHSVSALVLNGHGYHPVGEAMDKERLLGYVKKATKAAISNLEHVRVSCQSITVPAVKVIGAKQLEALCLLVDGAVRRAKKTVVPTFTATGLLLMLFLLFI